MEEFRRACGRVYLDDAGEESGDMRDFGEFGIGYFCNFVDDRCKLSEGDG